MPLHESFKTGGGGGSARLSQLSKMSSVPTIEDLTFALGQAQKARKRPIVLIWRTAEVPTGFCLTVTCGPDPDLPSWHLQFGDEAPRDLWTHASSDTTLIQGLIVAEHESAMNNLAMAQASAQAAQKMQRHQSSEWHKPADQPEKKSLPQWQKPALKTKASDQENQDHSQSNHQGAQQHSQNEAQWRSGQHEVQSRAEQLDTAGGAGSRPLPAPIDLDRTAVESVHQLITNSETGLLTHSAFLFFFLREFRQFQKCGAPFSMVQFELLYNTNGFLQAPPPEGLREAVRRIKQIVRPLDWIAHYESSEYAILMPHTKRTEAHSIVSSIYQSIYAEPLAANLEPTLVVFSCGVASFPEDCEHPGVLLAAARDAKAKAKLNMQPIVLFADS